MSYWKVTLSPSPVRAECSFAMPYRHGEHASLAGRRLVRFMGWVGRRWTSWAEFTGGPFYIYPGRGRAAVAVGELMDGEPPEGYADEAP